MLLAIDEAIELQEEITPHLIAIVQETAANPRKYLLNNSMSHIYAVMLLAYFRESKAHQATVELFSLPKHFISPLFEDLIMEDLASILVQTCGGSVEQIKQLILNKQAYEYCRSATVTALTYAVLEGYETRENAIQFLSSLFTGTEDNNPDSSFWAMIVDDMVNLYSEEAMPVIEKAFADDLIDEFFINLDFVHELMAKGKEELFQKLREEKERRSIDDIHASMAWWAMFDSKEDQAIPPPMSPTLLPPHHLQRKKGTRKNKREKYLKLRKRKIVVSKKAPDEPINPGLFQGTFHLT